ncbi:MAG: DUF6090 family protein [Gemmatimonadales bacterium]|jgi:hypothetical protein
MRESSSTRYFTRMPWRDILVQGLLIVVSVYLAIVLEGISADRRDAREARQALVQMLGEMRQDRADLQEIRAEQRERDGQYADLDRWLSAPASMPADSFAAALSAILGSNRTLYPRRSAWTTMVAAGQLRDLDDPELVTRLGNFYESVNDRVIDNGNDYDASVDDVGRNSAIHYWDPSAGRLLTSEAAETAVFRNQLRYLHESWNVWYLDLLGAYERQLDALIGEIETYLQAHGGG